MKLFGRAAPVFEPPVPEAERVPIGVVGVGQMGRHHARILSRFTAPPIVIAASGRSLGHIRVGTWS